MELINLIEFVFLILFRAIAFSITVLKDYNEDAVMRLLQSLLKYEMMDEYSKVLQVLFAYKSKFRSQLMSKDYDFDLS